jgi:hypothetical protein
MEKFPLPLTIKLIPRYDFAGALIVRARVYLNVPCALLLFGGEM